MRKRSTRHLGDIRFFVHYFDSASSALDSVPCVCVCMRACVRACLSSNEYAAFGAKILR